MDLLAGAIQQEVGRKVISAQRLRGTPCGVEQQFAGIEEIVLAKKPALRALSSFDGGGDLAVGRGEPGHNV